MEHITTQHTDAVFEIILNRPDKRNALRVQMLQAIAEAVTVAENSAGVRVILVRGEGACFSAGIDVATFGGMPEILGDNWLQHGWRATRLWQTNISALQETMLPTVALMHSYTLGAGLELALGCDLRIAAEDVSISLEEARLGLIPDAGGTTRLTQLVGIARAKELIFTGKRIDASTALSWGLVNEVVPIYNLHEAGMALAAEICQAAPLAVSAAKRIINAMDNVADGLHHEMVAQNPLFGSQDVMEGFQAKLERRAPNWKGH